MLNLTLEVMFKKKNSALLSEIQSAIQKTRQILFDQYANGIEIPKGDITAGKKTAALAYCKCFETHSVDHFPSYEAFIQNIYQLWTGNNQRIGKQDLRDILPDPAAKLGVSQIRPLLKGLGLMLFMLWTQDAIILTPKFKMPTVKKNRGNIKSSDIMGAKYATEILHFFLSFRQGINRDENAATLLTTHQALTPSLQNNLQSYGWRFLVATDWHTVDRANPDEALSFLEQVNQHRRNELVYVDMPVPLKSMLYMLQEHFPDSIIYDIHNIEFKVAGSQKKSQYSDTSPENISKFNTNGNGENHYLTASTQAQYWVVLEKKYINLRKKKGYKSYKTDHLFLSVLNHYLYVSIPSFQVKQNIPLFIPSPAEFTRQVFEGTNTIPALTDVLAKDRATEPLYDLMRQIDLFFDYIETVADGHEATKGFKNPIFRSIDFPLTRKRQGTTKKTISQLHSPTLLAYVYAIYEFAWFVHQAILETPELAQKISSKYRSTGYESDYIETSEFGLTPFLVYREKIYPIFKIHKSLLNTTRRSPNGSHKNSINLPNLVYLAQFLVAFETGIRNIHIRWLDRDSYDSEIDRNKPLPAICPLVVNTDKTKNTAWSSWVSRRVIHILDRLKTITENLNEPWLDEQYYYDGHIETQYEKIKTVFAKGGITKEDGKPFSESSYSNAFMVILYFFQEFCNTAHIFAEAIHLVECEKLKGNKRPLLTSNITPHSARATLVSNHIKILPPSVLGQYCTGHESDAVVAYYTVIDSAYMNNVSKSQALSIHGEHPLLSGHHDATPLQAENVHSLLKQAVNQNISDAFSDFGAVSFDLDEREQLGHKSGIGIAKTRSTDQIAFNSTHLCPYNNSCPDDVVKTTGAMQCGQCYASIKTVDHLPRILAHIRLLHAEIRGKTQHIKQLLKHNKTSDEVLNNLEIQRNNLAQEESAWIATHAVLEGIRQDLKSRDSYLIRKPEIIEKHLEMMATDHSPLTNILTRIRDAKMYPEYFTPQLESHITRLRNKILAQSGDIDRIINQPNDYELLDEFRGIIRSVCDATSTTMTGLSKAMSVELPSTNTTNTLLEIN